MAFVLQPWHVLITILSLLLHEHLQRRIDFLNNQVEELMKLNGKKRILLNDDARRSLAVKGRSLGLKALRELTTIITPETIMRWHRDLVAKKWDHSHKRNSVGRPRVRQEIVDLVVRIAKENSNWGYDRIQGALSNIGHHIADCTVGNILKDHGIEPAPERQRTGQWSAFLKAHWERLISRPLKFGRLKGSSLITCCLQSLCEPNFVGIAANFGITLATSPLKPPRWWTLNTSSLTPSAHLV